MLFYLDNLQIIGKSVSLHCVFHSIRFKVNKGWSKALLLFLCPYVSFFTIRHAPSFFIISFISVLRKGLSCACMLTVRYPDGQIQIYAKYRI